MPLRDLGVAVPVLHAGGQLRPHNAEGFFVHEFVIHNARSFDLYLKGDRRIGFERHALFPGGGGGHAMERLEGAGECGRGIVAILDRHVDHLVSAVLQIDCGPGEPPVADVFRQRHLRHVGKHPLKMVGRAAGLLRRLRIVDRPVQVILDIRDCLV